MPPDVALQTGDESRTRLIHRLDRLGLLVVLAIAALARLPGIAARGRFDADQGTDMLVLLNMTRDGVLPLLGAKTSVGDFHQAAFYYYALWPAAAISDADPVAVTLWIALMGIAAAGLAWWLGRSIAGSSAGMRGTVAGLAAGLLVAVSPAAIEASTFIWNPNLIPLCALLAVSAAWHAHVTRRSAWWLLAIAAAGAIPGLHVIGVGFFVAIVALWLVELLRAPVPERRGLLAAAGGGALVVGLLFLPLIVHELETGFAEARLITEYLVGGRLGGGADALARLPFTVLRVVATPFTGLVTDVPMPAVLIACIVAVLIGARLVIARGSERTGLAWLVGLTAWGILVLAVAAPALQHVVPGFPTDHYHAFLDPLLAVAVGVAIAGLGIPAAGPASGAPRSVSGVGMPVAGAAAPVAGAAVPATGVAGPPGGATTPAAVRRGGAVIMFGALVLSSIARWPPRVDQYGGWPAMQAAGERVLEHVGSSPARLLSVPELKQPDAIGFPFVRAGGLLAADAPGEPGADRVVVVCDVLFEGVVGLTCGGPAEDALVRDRLGGAGTLLEVVSRFPASSRTWISIYEAVDVP